LVLIVLVLPRWYTNLMVQIIERCTQQATQGEALSFIEESEPGDLAFLITKKVESSCGHH
jgi:hypothetical protein